MCRIVVHGVDRRAHLFVCQGEEPPNAATQPFRQMQRQGLNQHQVGELLRARLDQALNADRLARKAVSREAMRVYAEAEARQTFRQIEEQRGARYRVSSDRGRGPTLKPLFKRARAPIRRPATREDLPIPPIITPEFRRPGMRPHGSRLSREGISDTALSRPSCGHCDRRLSHCGGGADAFIDRWQCLMSK